MAKQEEVRKTIGVRMAKIRRAVSQIVKASEPWSNEIKDELAKLPTKERAAFIKQAGWAVAELGDYIATAGGGR